MCVENSFLTLESGYVRYRYVILLSVLAASCSAADNTPNPNVIIILVDDLGWTDTGVYGSSFYETPAIDRLAEEGVRWTQFYAASGVCSPTRASIMTGRHPARLHLTNWIGGEQKGQLIQAPYVWELPLEEVTLGEMFHASGYRTGYLGKWHLGTGSYMPKYQGFEYTRAVNGAGQPGSFFSPYENPNYPLTNVPDLSGDSVGDYLTDRLTDMAIDFITGNHERPFLLLLSHYAVHTPLESRPELEAYYENKTTPDTTQPAFAPEGMLGTTRLRQNHTVYAGMIASVDESVRRITAALDSLDLSDNTIVVFTSDNGGLSTLQNDLRWAPTSNLPLRAGKGFLYEGGIRIPLIIRVPSADAGQVTHTPGTTNDLAPTLLALSGIPIPDGLDGSDLSAVLYGGSARDRALYWHFPHYHGSGNRPSGAIRRGDLKLIEWFENDRTELFDLGSDPGESTDLSAERTDDKAELLSDLHAWRQASGARMPTPNPDHTVR